MFEKKAALKKMLKTSQPLKAMPKLPMKQKTEGIRKFKTEMPLPNTGKKMPILKDKIRKLKQEEPAWKKKDYKPGSIMRGYTKYA